MSLRSHELKESKQMRLRILVLVCEDVMNDIIIGLPSIKAYNLLPYARYTLLVVAANSVQHFIMRSINHWCHILIGSAPVGPIFLRVDIVGGHNYLPRTS